MANLVDGILTEIDRCNELVKQYEKIGPAGAFGRAAIKADIQEGKDALASGDVVRMVAACKALKNCE